MYYRHEILERFEYIWLGNTKRERKLVNTVEEVNTGNELGSIDKNDWVHEILVKYEDIFHKKGNAIGETKVSSCKIDTYDNLPINQPYRRIIHSDIGEVKNQMMSGLKMMVL